MRLSAQRIEVTPTGLAAQEPNGRSRNVRWRAYPELSYFYPRNGAGGQRTRFRCS
jgi:hypothetical protein